MMADSGTPIRILLFADLHLGLERYGSRRTSEALPTRTQDTLHALEELIANARAEPPDLILFAGDAFKSPQPEPTLLQAFAEKVLALAELAPLVLLVGRQDAAPTAERASSLAIFATLSVPQVLVAETHAVHRIETKRGPLTLATAPHCSPREGLAEALPTLAQEAEAGKGPRLLLGHLTVEEAQRGDEDVLANAALPLDQLALPPWDGVALGGIHRQQALTSASGPLVLYPGSLARLDFSEAEVEKGFLRLEIRRGRVDWTFVPVAARPFIRIRADLREASDPLEALQIALAETDLAGTIVRAELRLTRAQDETLAERSVRQLLRAAGAEHVAASRRELSGPLKTRLNVADAEPPALLERYLELRGKDRGQAFTAAERAALLTAAQEIWAELAEEGLAAG